MRHRVCSLLAAASLLTMTAAGAARPQFGGTLRVESRATLASYDPTQTPTFDVNDLWRDRVAEMVFDRLVTLDVSGKPQPALATSWQSDPDLRRWTFELRSNVKLHDGNTLAGRLVAAALAAANPGWRVSVQANGNIESLVVVSAEPQPNLPAQLAIARNSIISRASDGTLIGSGPFKMQDWQPGRKATLTANADYWGGRPFIQSVELLMARSLRDQALDYRLDRADVIEVSPESTRRAESQSERIDVSANMDVLGVLFPASTNVNQHHQQQALSFAMDRSAIQSVILQRQGEAAGGLLPQWISGYAFLFPAKARVDLARQERSATTGTNFIVLAFDATDALQRAVAERVSVNARDAGLNVQTFAESGTSRAPSTAARIAVLHLASPCAEVALKNIGVALDVAQSPAMENLNTPEALFSAERNLTEARFVPIVAMGEAYAVAPRIRNWHMYRDGEWALQDVSLEGVH